MRWTAAVALSSNNLGSGSEFVYQARSLDDSTGKWKGAIFNGSAEDGRGTNLSGVNTSDYSGYASLSIAQTGAKFYTIEDIPEQIGLQATGSSNFAVLIRTE